MMSRFSSWALARLGPVVRRDEQIAGLERALTELRRQEERSSGVPSFRRYIDAERRIAAHLRKVDQADRGHVLTHKLKSYSFAKSHDVDVPQIFGIWDRPEDITWDELPDLVVIKSVNGTSARGVIPLRRDAGGWTKVTTIDTIEPAEIVHRLTALEASHHVSGPYFAEELLGGGGSNNSLPVDVKIHAFHGEISHVLLRRVSIQGQNSGNSFRVVFPDGADAGPVLPGLVHDESIPLPEHLDQLCRAASRLSGAIPRAYVRIDMYEIDGRIVFGEFTPRPGEPMNYGPELDEKFGHLWERAQARVLDELLNGADARLRFGPRPRQLMIGERPYLPKGA